MSANQHQQGQFLQADFFDNSRGLNLTDSPIRVLDEQATQGYNYEYSVTGGFRKRRGHALYTTTPDAQLRHLGTSVLIDYSNNKTVIRTAGTKIQNFDVTTGLATNLTEDTTVGSSDFFSPGQTAPTMFSQFNTPSSQVLWCTGSGLSRIVGIYSGSKATENGSSPAQGTLGFTVTPTDGGIFIGAGTYYYAVTLHKASTGAESNAALDASATIGATTDSVTIDLTGITPLDTTKYDQIWIYRSNVSGVSGFTVGDLIAQVPSTDTSYKDTGGFLATAQNIPRKGNIILDNSVLPAGTPSGLVNWKRHLVTAIGSTLYYSDLNKPESWPLTNTLQIPSGGPITGVGSISFNTPTAVGTDEFLAVFKENELWLITGNDYTDVSLQFIDRTGCINQALMVNANGYLAFIDYRGIYLWDGSGKPIYCSRPIEYAFSPDGTLDKSKLNIGWGTFHHKTNQIIWVLSDSVLGENQYGLKLDLRLTLPGIQNSLMGRILEGIFIQDSTAFPLYGGSSVLPSSDEALIAGDASGLIYNMYTGTADATNGNIGFQYQTKSIDLGLPFQTKRIQKIIVWVEDSTDENLTLNYWTTYNTDPSNESSQMQPVSRRVTRAIWDLAYWDAASWDGNVRTYSPLVYNISSPKGGEGEAFTLQFEQQDPNAPVSIAGFSIIYTLGGLRK